MLKIGDRVIMKNPSPVGHGNIGTITYIISNGEYYIINWDNKGPKTYKDSPNKNQWSCWSHEIELSNEAPVTKHDLICKKIKYLETKFKERNSHYDF